MGHKVNPIVMRLGITRSWHSEWFAQPNAKYVKLTAMDMAIRNKIAKEFPRCGIVKNVIEILGGRTVITIHSAKPGLIIGEKGTKIDLLRRLLSSVVGSEVGVNVEEARRAIVCASLINEDITTQVERAVNCRRIARRIMQHVMRYGAMGIRIKFSGRLGGVSIARQARYQEGKVPLHTLNAHVDYDASPALCKYGSVGVKTWTCVDPNKASGFERRSEGGRDGAHSRRRGPDDRPSSEGKVYDGRRTRYNSSSGSFNKNASLPSQGEAGSTAHDVNPNEVDTLLKMSNIASGVNTDNEV